MFEPREISLSDGRPACIRRARLEDAEALLEVERALHADGRGIVQSPDQMPPDAVAMRHKLARLLGDAGRLMLIGEVLAPHHRVVGQATIGRFQPAYLRHVGILAIGIEPAHQELGLGRAMMQALIDHAPSMGLTRLELYVRDDNARARALYASLGFETEGVRRRFVRLPDGTYHDDHILALLLD